MSAIRNLACAVVFCFVAGSFFQPTEAMAQTMTWRLHKTYSGPVQVELYSQNRNFQWPGGGKVIGLNDNKTYKFVIECNYGENICLGAWTTGPERKIWGVGPKNRKSCQICCQVCDRVATPVQVID